jgi:hypothetical protein
LFRPSAESPTLFLIHLCSDKGEVDISPFTEMVDPKKAQLSICMLFQSNILPRIEESWHTLPLFIGRKERPYFWFEIDCYGQYASSSTALKQLEDHAMKCNIAQSYLEGIVRFSLVSLVKCSHKLSSKLLAADYTAESSIDTSMMLDPVSPSMLSNAPK